MNKTEKKNLILIALGLLVIIVLIVALNKKGPKLPPPTVKEQLSEEQVLENLSAPENGKPYKPDPNLIKKLSAPGAKQ